MVRLVVLIELRRPHLVLANVGRNDRFPFGLFVQLVNDLLHLQAALLLECKREFGFVALHFGQPLLGR